MKVTRIYAGTSGFSYKEWRGSFYPVGLAPKDMLEHYARQLPAVEINNTFYRMPTVDMLSDWRARVPATFRFAVKAPRRLTHVKRLSDCEAEVEHLSSVLATLGEQLGSILLQLPPHFRKDVSRLGDFLAALPQSLKAAFEFRHPSWFDQPVYDLLGARNLALVISETEESETELPWTADWAYLRLRKPSYDETALGDWIERLARGSLREAQVFFKHEDEATGPRLAKTFLELAAQSGLAAGG